MKTYSIRVNNSKQFKPLHEAIAEILGQGGFIKSQQKLRDGWDTMYHIECNDDTEFFELCLEVKEKEAENSRKIEKIERLSRQMGLEVIEVENLINQNHEIAG